MHIKRIAALAAVSVAAVAGSALPAEAHPGAVVFTGSAQTSGTWVPVSPACPTGPTGPTCRPFNSWSFVSDSDVAVGVGIDPLGGPGRVSGAGNFTGWCGHSTGSGTFSAPGHSGEVTWASAGTIIVLTGSANGHAVAAVVAARAQANTGNCVTAEATKFDVVGAAAVVGP